MASRKLPSSSGYFTKEALAILEKGEKQQATKAKTTSGSKGKTTKKK